MKKLAFLLIFLPFILFSSDEDIFKAMDVEIKRAMENLKLENLDKPYYISLKLKEVKIKTVHFSFGYEKTRDDSKFRNISVDLRVGSPEFDQTNFESQMDYYFFDLGSFGLAPTEDSFDVLRQSFWLALDNAYKKAQEKFSKKKGFIERFPQKNYPQDFLHSPQPFIYIEKMKDLINWEDFYEISKKLSSYFFGFDFLTSSNLIANFLLKKQYFLDSEGNKHLKIEPFFTINLSLECFSVNYYPLSLSHNWNFSSEKDPLSFDLLKKEADELINYLKEIREKEPLEKYSGPVVFLGEGSGSFFIGLLGKGVSGAREPLSEQKFRNPFKATGFLSKKLNQKILPSSYEVWDMPNLREYEGKKLLGFLPVDDEGIKPKDIQIVKGGKLISLPMRRCALEDYVDLNGHAREGQVTVLSIGTDSTVTNLIIEDKDGITEEEFFKKLDEIGEREGLEKILFIKKLKRGFDISQAEFDIFGMVEGLKGALSSPMIMYLYDLKTKKMESVWGLDFSSISENILKDIIASTKKQYLSQFYDVLSMDSLPYSVISPEMVLIEDLSLEKIKLQMTKKPLVEMP